MRRALYSNKRGSILIFALWIIAFLGILAAHIGLSIRVRASLLSRLEQRSQLHFIADAGIKDAIAALRLDWQRSHEKYTTYSKYYRHNNPDKYANIQLGRGHYNLFYKHYLEANVPRQRFGFIDEESKININFADREVLRRLMTNILLVDDQTGQNLAEAIIDWREAGKTQLEGFWSDDYYANLKYPYESKEAEFELIDELLLVKGFTSEVYQKILPFITVYGDGLVNINTASLEVLKALGLDHGVAAKLLIVRRGVDEEDATIDDHLFETTHDVASEVSNFVKLTAKEMRQIDSLNNLGRIKTNSFFYLMQSVGRLEGGKETLQVTCIYNIDQSSIEYWKEKYL